MKRTMPVIACALLTVVAPFAAIADETISFAEGQWDAAQWTPLRLPLHETLGTFVQRADSLGTDTFTDEQKKAHEDNVLLMMDSGMDEGEFEVRFRIGPEQGTAPGVFLSPTVEGDALVSGIAVFVASYTMAAWQVSTDPETRETNYPPLARINRWQDPDIEHVMRIRYSTARHSMLLQIDDSDVVMLTLPDFGFNSRIGIWGCHGTCDYYSVTTRSEGTLPWSAVAPEE